MHKANWPKFRDLLQATIEDLPQPDKFNRMNIDDIIEIFTEAVVKQAELSIPTST